MQFLGSFFKAIFNFCLKLAGKEWLSIILFTFITKIILLPVSVMVQKNSIKMVRLYPSLNRIKAKYFGNKDMISEKEYELYKTENYHPLFDLVPVLIQLVLLMGVVEAFPPGSGKSPAIIPIGAALSALVMCLAQNRSNVLQSEQSKLNKWGTLSFSVALSLYLGLFVSWQVGFYWICSNLMATIQMYILNFAISPKKYINYEDLEQSRDELERVKAQAVSGKKERSRELIAREKADYKRFLKFDNKQIVFYSEKNGFYKYFRDIIENILHRTDIIIHYISSDPEDEIFQLESDHFRTYYIDEKLMVLMMRMEADIVAMTTPDLQTYYLKRSMVKNDIEYIYIDHAMNSVNLTYHKNALDNFDTIFIPNDLTAEEIRKAEALYGLKEKKLVKYGYAMIDNMIKSYSAGKKTANNPPVILIAPSWQEGNIMDSCIDRILTAFRGGKYSVIVRPHPQYVRHCSEKLEQLKARFSDAENIVLQTDFSSNETVFNADILITDWSGIAYEYAFTTLKPVIYVNTPMKIMNPDYQELGIEPFDLVIRDEIGISVEPENAEEKILSAADDLIENEKISPERIAELRNKYLYNVGTSAKAGADYIIKSLIEKSGSGKKQ